MDASRPTPDMLELAEPPTERWRRIDALLRRLLSRLTYAAEGRTATLDSLLGELRAATRKPLDETQLQPWLGALTEAVTALDDAAHWRPDENDSPPNRPLLAVLDHLQLGEPASTDLQALRQRIAGCSNGFALQQHGAALAELVSGQLQQLEQDRLSAGQLLNQVSGQLATLTDCLDQDDAAHRDDAAARWQLDERMRGEVQALGEQARRAPNLASLQADVQSRLATVNAQLAALREREQAREQAWRESTERMRERIQQLESNTHDMEATLEQKRRLAETDPLTGLANRRALEERLALLGEPDVGRTSLLLMDIDHFKAINDRLGHAAGDRALCIVAQQMQAALRPDDFLARYGGEEFVAVLAANADEAMQVAERLRQRIATTGFHSQNQPIAITLSCGLATLTADETPLAALERADQALYRAKQAGRNRSRA